MFDHLNMKSAVIEYELSRLECKLNPRPTYPCKDFNDTWDHYDNCENCDFGYWKTYKQENK